MQLVADRSGLGIERKRLDEAEQARGSMYSEASATRSCSPPRAPPFDGTRQLPTEPSTLVDIVVPAFSDWCAIDLRDDTGDLRRLAVRHATDRSDAVSEEFRRRVPMIDAMAARSVETEPFSSRRRSPPRHR